MSFNIKKKQKTKKILSLVILIYNNMYIFKIAVDILLTHIKIKNEL